MSHTNAGIAGLAREQIPTWNLALSFQEALTAILRLRTNADSVPSADTFRTHIKTLLGAARKDAEAHGYSPEDIRSAMFAVVALLDESVLTSRNPVFAEWPRMPLQEEIFGGHVAGEIFFQDLRTSLARAESPKTIDLLEVYYLCLLLGYRGRFGASGAGELRGVMTMLREKISRARGAEASLSAHARIPDEGPPRLKSDPWVRRLKIAALVSAFLAATLFVTFKAILVTGASAIRPGVVEQRS